MADKDLTKFLISGFQYTKPSDPANKMCHAYMKNGYCKFGKTCKYRHEEKVYEPIENVLNENTITSDTFVPDTFWDKVFDNPKPLVARDHTSKCQVIDAYTQTINFDYRDKDTYLELLKTIEEPSYPIEVYTRKANFANVLGVYLQENNQEMFKIFQIYDGLISRDRDIVNNIAASLSIDTELDMTILCARIKAKIYTELFSKDRERSLEAKLELYVKSNSEIRNENLLLEEKINLAHLRLIELHRENQRLFKKSMDLELAPPKTIIQEVEVIKEIIKEIEVIKEVIIEIPIEKIVEVTKEIVREVPVEKIVERVVYERVLTSRIYMAPPVSRRFRNIPDISDDELFIDRQFTDKGQQKIHRDMSVSWNWYTKNKKILPKNAKWWMTDEDIKIVQMGRYTDILGIYDAESLYAIDKKYLISNRGT
jgi:hypothetical protein